MNSMERVVAALQGTPSGQRAFTLTLSLYGAKLTGCPLPQYYTQPERYAQGQIAVAEQCRPDIIFTPFALALEAQAFGGEVAFPGHNPPSVKKPFIRKPQDIGRIKVPDPEHQEELLYLQTSARLLANHFKGTVPICGVLTSPMDLPAIIMGMEGWLELLLFDRERTAEMIAIMSEYFVAMANTMFANGINFLALPMMFTNPQLVFAKTVEEVVVPALAGIFAKINGPIVFHHGGNPLARYLPLYRGLPNVGGFVLDPRDDFAEARQGIGDTMLLLGNLDGPSLGKISPAQAVAKAKIILDNRKDDRHFIFASTAADVAWDTPLATITGIHDLMAHYGTAP